MTEIRSYRRVFDLERRVYSIDRMRLNPAGVPVRGVVYLLAALAVALAGGALPLVGRVERFVPWYLRDVGLPAVLAGSLALLRIDGRSFHTAAAAIAGRRLRPRRLAALTGRSRTGSVWRPPPIVMLPDGSDPGFRRMRYVGPGAVHVRRGHRREGVHERAQAGLGQSRAVPGSRRPAWGPRRAVLLARYLGRSPRRAALRLSADAGAGASSPAVIALAPGASLKVLPERPRV